MHPALGRAMTVTPMRPDDWPSVRDIYAEGIVTGNARFETEAATEAAWDAGHVQSCRFVARSGEEVLGWAALSPVSGRCVYAGVAEVSVYVRGSAGGQGIGTLLLRALI